jgi:ribosomal-protein-alanine N-acetyltransferase
LTPAPLETERLRLVPATLELADADLHNRLEFMHQLGALVLDSWPPPLNDESSMRYTVDFLRRSPGDSGWAAWYWIAKKHKPVVIGQGGFKGPPADGAVEIGYSLLSEFQKKGYASEAVAALLAWAFAHDEVERVAAETLPELAPSIRLLERAGFENVGRGSEEGVLRFELRRRLSRPGAAPRP